VLSDKALESIVRTRPRTDDDLAALRDVGPSTRERHGARLLAVVAECEAEGPAQPAQGRLAGT
jgi:ribonuclease D